MTKADIKNYWGCICHCFSYTPSWFGLIRMGLWTTLFLVLFGVMLPKREQEVMFSQGTLGTDVTPMMLMPGESGVIRQGLTQRHEFNIAWIAGSSSVIYEPGTQVLDLSVLDRQGLLQLKTLSILKNEYGVDAGVNMYLLLSLRMLNAYTLVASALEEQPDLVVLTLNPFFVFNNHASFKPESHFSIADQFWTKRPETWPWMFLFTAPGDHFWAAAGRHFPVLQDKYAFKPDYSALKNKIWQKLMPKLEGAPETLKAVTKMQDSSLVYWVLHRQLKGDLSKLIDKEFKVINTVWYKEVIKLSDTSNTSINVDILEKILSLLEDSQIPAILYLAPVSKELQADDLAWGKYTDIYNKLAQLAELYTESKIKIVYDIPVGSLGSITFAKNDNIHLTDEGMLDDYLAKLIYDHLNQEK